MAAITRVPTIEKLIERGQWQEARRLVEKELVKQPDNHWLLTQLGATYFEQRRYRESLRPLLSALEVVPDCPLTLWNIAGALDALNKPELAIPIYAWLLGSTKFPDDDPCWESEEWTSALKTDCVFRIGTCFQHMERWQSAEHCFRQYINLLLAGMNGTYPIEDAAQCIRELNGKAKHTNGKEVRDAIASILHESGFKSIYGGRQKVPKLPIAELLAT